MKSLAILLISVCICAFGQQHSPNKYFVSAPVAVLPNTYQETTISRLIDIPISRLSTGEAGWSFNFNSSLAFDVFICGPQCAPKCKRDDPLAVNFNCTTCYRDAVKNSNQDQCNFMWKFVSTKNGTLSPAVHVSSFLDGISSGLDGGLYTVFFDNTNYGTPSSNETINANYEFKFTYEPSYAAYYSAIAMGSFSGVLLAIVCCLIIFIIYTKKTGRHTSYSSIQTDDDHM